MESFPGRNPDKLERCDDSSLVNISVVNEIHRSPRSPYFRKKKVKNICIFIC